MEPCGPGLQSPWKVRGMLGAQVSEAGDSEVLVPFPTSFIPVSFTVSTSDSCGDPGCGGSWF